MTGVQTCALPIYSGKSFDQVMKDCDRNHWMTAEEAKAYGLVDEIIEKRR